MLTFAQRLGMMTLLGQHGQALDFERGVSLIKFAAETADENAPQGAYVRSDFSDRGFIADLMDRFLGCYKHEKSGNLMFRNNICH